MPKINVLDKHIAELIAAGEVVDRPASVVKELVENSMDAGATNITVEIQNGGNTYIRVTDDGCGIEPEDVPKAFLRHATSKIQDEMDLESIHTFGFRGEALASVAAVSHVEILTRTHGAEMGCCCAATDCEIEEVTEAGCPEGTTIIVRDLFYNTPARQKFLKKDVSESNAVEQVVEKLALSHSEIKFRFIRDNEVKFTTYGNNDMLSVIFSIYGREYANNMLNVNYSKTENKKISVSGYITKPGASKSNRAFQVFFVNKRYVKNKLMSAAIEEAFKGCSMVGKFPGCVINVEMPPEAVDVNVHPTKAEVRFVNEKEVFDLIYYGVKSVLDTKDLSVVLEESKKNNKDFWERNFNKEDREYFEEIVKQTTLPQISPDKPVDVKYDVVDYVSDVKSEAFTETPYRIDEDISHSVQYQIRKVADNAINNGEEIPVECIESIKAMKAAGAPVPNLPRKITDDDFPLGKLKYVGEVFKTYILLESVNELIFIDKHAAHERMLYEKLRSKEKAFDGQVLLKPITCTLGKEQCEAVIENPDEFERFGFEIDDFGNGSILVRTLPFWVSQKEAENVISEIADSLISCKHDITPEKLDKLYASISCRAAIKANDNNSEFELEKIVNVLLNDPNIKYCPHGRPISVSISKNKLEHMFGRLQ